VERAVKAHVMTAGLPLADFQRLARRAESAGFSGLVVTEAARTPFLSCAAASLAGADLDLATGVAVAFPRSPMVSATLAWELAEATGGRFRLGLGTQVRAHMERRYGVEFDRPGPRLREYVEAVRAVFAAFRGDRALAFEGRYHELSLLPRAWSPGPIDVPDPPLDVAAVNPWMLRMAGEVADGVHVHPMNTPTYLEQTVLPNLLEGAARAATPRRLALFVPLFTVAGDDEAERARYRDAARRQIGFYGSTPNYRFVFEQLGRGEVGDRLRSERPSSREELEAILPDDVLSNFVVEAGWDDLAAAVAERCRPLAAFDVHVVLYLAGAAALREDDEFERFGEVARRLRRPESPTSPAGA
jgi:probable F420-dependent oxidoreductase